jgi:hypothetical protein
MPKRTNLGTLKNVREVVHPPPCWQLRAPSFFPQLVLMEWDSNYDTTPDDEDGTQDSREGEHSVVNVSLGPNGQAVPVMMMGWHH